MRVICYDCYEKANPDKVRNFKNKVFSQSWESKSENQKCTDCGRNFGIFTKTTKKKG